MRKLSPYKAAVRGGWRNAWPALLRGWRRDDCLKPGGGPTPLMFCYGFPRNHLLQEQYEA